MIDKSLFIPFLLSMIILIACKKETPTPNPSILSQLASNYEQLPEADISISLDNQIYAQYAGPTDRYQHGILGDRIEASQLVVVKDDIFYERSLSEDYVFEDIRPRLYDVDGDNELEFITIRSHVSQGAGIVIYKIINDALVEYASVVEIGIPNRWLNIVAINDLDDDGTVELSWIQTPHIGGILKVAKISSGELQVIDETEQFSNHSIGERNLCLSTLTEQSGEKIFYVPNQTRDTIVGFTFENMQLQVFEKIDQVIDFSNILSAQYNFDNLVNGENNCINP